MCRAYGPGIFMYFDTQRSRAELTFAAPTALVRDAIL